VKSILVGNRSIGGENDEVFVIAEIGVNFDSVETAIKMVDAAAKVGADSVKIQTFRADTLAMKGATFTFEDGSRVSQYEFWKAHEASPATHRILKGEVERRGMIFFSTPSHYEDADLLEDLGVELYKVGSDDLTNYPFLEYIAKKGKPMIVSTGMCELGEIEEAVRRILATGNDQLILLHCLVGYPAPRRHANINVIRTLQQAFGLPIGFSDHTPGNLAAILAASLGAVAVEKHFTIDKSAGGPDNDTSALPDEMVSLIADLRDVRHVLGSGVKRIQPGEMKWREAGRKSLVAARSIEAGEIITRDMIEIKRPSSGLHPRYFEIVVGRHAATRIDGGELITWDRLSG
jgi:N,N'-diacetyllegionaminate synthase